MLSAIAVTVIILATLAYAPRSPGRIGELIAHRPYNNLYNDASGAREDHLG
jgi:hypothetical protein